MTQPRNAVVTGSSTGIGFAIAKDLLGRGFNVFICGRDEHKLKIALDVLVQDFGSDRIAGSLCDVRILESVELMISSAVKRFGGIDILINNAGVAFITPFEDIKPQDWRDILDTNLTGIYNCCHVALPWLKKGNHSDIVNIGSRSGRYSFAGGVGYNTTKFGLQGFTEAMFLDLHQYGIRVSLVAPGTVATNLVSSSSEDWHLLPEDVAQVVGNILESNARATVNWVEVRPARPGKPS